jgi:hypothetical protein
VFLADASVAQRSLMFLTESPFGLGVLLAVVFGHLRDLPATGVTSRLLIALFPLIDGGRCIRHG